MSDQKEELHVQSGEAQEAPPDAPPEAKKGGIGSMLSAPGAYGDAAGEKIQGTLGKVGGPVGKGLSTIASPVGGLVEPLVGGLFKAPENFAHATDAIDDVDRHNEEMERPIAGEEETGANPLGLHQGGKGEGA